MIYLKRSLQKQEKKLKVKDKIEGQISTNKEKDS